MRRWSRRLHRRALACSIFLITTAPSGSTGLSEAGRTTGRRSEAMSGHSSTCAARISCCRRAKRCDFSFAQQAGRIAVEEGAAFLCGGHVAHWHEWDDSEYYPNWDSTTGVSTPQGYLQLRLYFSQWAQVIRANGWQGRITQALADEPQTHNDKTYRALAAICRKFLPGVPILDAVETTNLGGGVDIWVPKQDT